MAFSAGDAPRARSAARSNKNTRGMGGGKMPSITRAVSALVLALAACAIHV